MSDRHAYLIMAHHRPDILKELLVAVDDTRNDVFLHIDRKSNIDAAALEMQKSDLNLIPSTDVSWGGYSQIECMMALMEAASEAEEYAYYHMLSGAAYPLKSQNEIHRIFASGGRREYIDIDERAYEERVRYRWLFNEAGKTADKSAVLRFLRQSWIDIQKALGVDHFAGFGLECKKGLAYWSLTHEAVAYVLENRDLVEKIFRRSICGDELFVQTILFNSHIRSRVADDKGHVYGSSVMTTWPLEDAGYTRNNHCFIAEDIVSLMDSDKCFALKFDGPDGLQLIRRLKERNGNR